MKILMVCLGNICRSPLAEGILKSKVNSAKVFVDSAGTSGYHQGELPDSRSIATAKKRGIDITDQRSRQFLIADFDSFDWIYAMDESNYRNIISLSRGEEDTQKVKMILNEAEPNSNLSVPDPYYGGDKGFDNVFDMLDEACEIIASKIIDK
ncbi:low molecular weight protein-tyrosine-phosphatase [Tenacibaculum sp. IB213877]|uniref:low molecular weight protein-tyrosine-phosphatase n=1 Tax=Tenacibaculum sp. IB213877 TaxID=3097351 RepID=UPI002A5AD01A|nr:low molecular weight protein-tyrosine-phosphatase [Tenacibaculum sp. IB213877]MDY0779183.1 low molecular weight protein-tyrosine-phosphatase [Tenacibaculum sp. IB213877]